MACLNCTFYFFTKETFQLPGSMAGPSYLCNGASFSLQSTFIISFLLLCPFQFHAVKQILAVLMVYCFVVPQCFPYAGSRISDMSFIT